MDNYNEWLDSFAGVKPHRYKHDGSFNNVLFSAELIAAKKELGRLLPVDEQRFNYHLKMLTDEHGGYAPKNSHDNLLGMYVGAKLIGNEAADNMQYKPLIQGQHPRDKILFGFFFAGKWWAKLLLPLALLDIVRAIYSSGKVRPKFWVKEHFMFRLKAKLGLIKPVKTGIKIHGGYADEYIWQGRQKHINYVQNDGKILNLLRLNQLREYSVLKPFVRLCKKMYISSMGEDFQSQLMANYFEEYDHPVRDAFRELDRLGKTIIDC